MPIPTSIVPAARKTNLTAGLELILKSFFKFLFSKLFLKNNWNKIVIYCKYINPKIFLSRINYYH